jgi:tetratricopeptide (TPR) repeat protein
MKVAAIIAVLGLSASLATAAQQPAAAPPRPAAAGQPLAPQATDRVAEAYEQFLRAHMFEQDENFDEALASYKRAIALDPTAAAISADLADLYLRQNRAPEAVAAAEQALKLAPENREAHRVLGTVYASMATGAPDNGAPRGGRAARGPDRENLTKAIQHLEQAFDPPIAAADANVRAMLARLYIAASDYDKAIPILADLVTQEPGWGDGPTLLVEAYSAAGRGAEAITWLEEAANDNPQLYGSLADFYGRERRWSESAGAYAKALERNPRSFDLRVRMASSLLNAGSRDNVAKAREALREALALRGTEERALYLMSQAERRLGEPEAAEATARKLITQNSKNPRGYLALAEALEEQRKYQLLVDALAPAMTTFRGSAEGAFAQSMLLPHLAFAYQELGQHDKAIATFEDARKLAPNDPSVVGYLIQAQLAAKNYSAAAELAKSARAQNPSDLRLARLESQALRRGGKVDQGLAILEEIARAKESEPAAHIALAQAYAEANRGAQAVKVLQDAQVRFPEETAITFELGTVLDRQKKFAESESVFRQLIAREPENAAALNYLGYMLADRGERLNESVAYLKRALALDPENGSFLDSIGWAYFKDGKIDLALENLKRAADQLQSNSVVQDHYGDALFKAGRYQEALEAWNRAISGDGDSIDRGGIDQKIRTAKQKLPGR